MEIGMSNELEEAVSEELAQQAGSRRRQQFFSEPGIDRFGNGW